ncbi:hypothetical protein BDP27DRAFT_169822 [Rhodocollybia butyracea]|uniref:Secreted protein n=1 Tax=Rhodocollybia butyracea TaxID=206335 RepID=A0A9P5PJ38_9AGAR|nr:hypothetical protein BDP27DRAFT_169822 [Rhodocollybia butyracea]
MRWATCSSSKWFLLVFRSLVHVTPTTRIEDLNFCEEPQRHFPWTMDSKDKYASSNGSFLVKFTYANIFKCSGHITSSLLMRMPTVLDHASTT